MRLIDFLCTPSIPTIALFFATCRWPGVSSWVAPMWTINVVLHLLHRAAGTSTYQLIIPCCSCCGCAWWAGLCIIHAIVIVTVPNNINNSTQQDTTRVLKNTSKNLWKISKDLPMIRLDTLLLHVPSGRRLIIKSKRNHTYQLSPPSTWSASSSNLLPLPCWQPPRPRASMQAAKATGHHPPPPNLFAGRSWTKTKMRTGGEEEEGQGGDRREEEICPLARLIASVR